MFSPPNLTTRSSLETMLDSIRQRDEKPKDIPPALPARPTSKARLPSGRKSLPKNFSFRDELGSEKVHVCSKENEGKKRERSFVNDENLGCRSCGKKNIKTGFVSPAESPYDRKVEEKNSAENFGENGFCDLKPDRSDNLSLVVKKKKLQVWCQSNGQWNSGTIESTSEENAVVMFRNSSVLTVPTGHFVPANPDMLDGIDDLIQLSYLNEPSVLHNLQHRYCHDKIYTKAGPILVAVNPFKDVESFGDELISAYRKNLTGCPHVYSVAETAFSGMMRDKVNQSIIINGETGSGKTETAKIALKYLVAVGGHSGPWHKILQTNFILEAFGNAKTARNDNSSRFGKLVEVNYSTTGKICGTKIETFLLEKSRVVQLAKGERSYHIFYQLCAGAPSTLKERLNLKPAGEYNYLKQSGCALIDDIDDAQRFDLLMKTLDSVQIHKEDQDNAFSMISAILWLGNISFEVIDNENHVEVVIDEAVTNSAKLMGCDVQKLSLTLSTRQVQAGPDTIVLPLTYPQAIDSRDELAKFIYASLFDWLVGKINKSLGEGSRQSRRSISILDIFGFESFQKNGLEQLCVNYANERLQQHFNRHLFKLEQEEYRKNGIDCRQVDFEDNQECLNLFEKKPFGLFSLLDKESSSSSKATDLTLASKLEQHLKANPCFKQETDRNFSVCHYAGKVLYSTSDFLEKNRDPQPSNPIQLLSSCTFQLPQLFASSMFYPLQMPSVGLKFKDQLFKLMQQLEATTPLFIRCIKPNDKKIPGIFDNELVLQQLKCCGVLEFVRISRSSYPTRVTHQQFARRYGFLLQENVKTEDHLSISVAILQKFNVHPYMYQVGYTKLFFRTEQIAALEDARSKTLQGILEIQKCFRGYQARCRFYELKRNAITLQSFIRGAKAQNEYQSLIKRWRAALLIQKYMKQKIARRLYGRRTSVTQALSQNMRNMENLSFNSTTADGEPYENTPELKDSKQELVQVPSSVLVELHRRVKNMEAALGQKDEENLVLKQQLKLFETRWSEYEAKMKSMEEMWQRQTESLQISVAAAKKNLAVDETIVQPGRPDAFPMPHSYDSEEATSVGTTTPESITPPKLRSRPSNVTQGRDSNEAFNAVSLVVKELDQRKQTFEDEARFLSEGRLGHPTSTMNPDEEYRKLKHRFEAWKKDYKVRLRETKMKIHKFGSADLDKSRKSWWGMKSMKRS